MATEKEIGSFWNSNPCGEWRLDQRLTFAEKLRTYDEDRYRREGHILGCLDAIDWRGKRVLEIGLGWGAESEQLIRRGAIWSGLDLTPAAVERTRTRLTVRGLKFEDVKVGSLLDSPYPDQSFDVVFSHGVLHHIPDIHKAQSEISRMLKPEGKLVCMLYARWSLNYLLSIAVVRRLALLALYPLMKPGDSMIGRHIKQARRVGLLKYLKLDNFIHRSTDGPENPYAQVYDVPRVRRDFPAFSVQKAYKRFMWAPPLPIKWLPLDQLLGWHLWVEMARAPSRNRVSDAAPTHRAQSSQRTDRW